MEKLHVKKDEGHKSVQGTRITNFNRFIILKNPEEITECTKTDINNAWKNVCDNTKISAKYFGQ